MKTFYFLHSLEKADFEYFQDKVSQIQKIEDIGIIISKYFHKIGENNEGKTQKSAFVEALIFLKVFLEKGLGTREDIQWVYAKNFLIYNDELFEFLDGTYQEIKEKVMFVTSRDSWKNPFFLYLSLYFRDRVDLIKPNLQIIDSGTDKLTAISQIWNVREQYVGDIVIPFLRNKNIPQIQYLLEFVTQKLGSRVMIKNNFGVEGKKVRALDLINTSQNILELSTSLKQDFFDIGVSTQNNAYFSRYYDILKEYRIYYTYSQTKEIHIYSVKNRENFSIEESLFQKRDFTRENLKIVWNYMHPDDFLLHEAAVYDACKHIIPLLGAEVGVLELCQEKDGTVRFIELNYLGGSLMYTGADETLMQEYYEDMWNISVSRK